MHKIYQDEDKIILVGKLFGTNNENINGNIIDSNCFKEQMLNGKMNHKIPVTYDFGDKIIGEAKIVSDDLWSIIELNNSHKECFRKAIEVLDDKSFKSTFGIAGRINKSKKEKDVTVITDMTINSIGWQVKEKQ